MRQALLELLRKALEEGLHAGKLLALVVHLACVELVQVVDLGLLSPRADALQQEVELDLLVHAALHAHGVLLVLGLHGLEPAAAAVHDVLQLLGLLGLADALQPAHHDLRHEAGVGGAVHAGEHRLRVLLLLQHVLVELLLCLLDGVLKLLVLLVVLVELRPGAPGERGERGVLVRPHARHDLLRVVRLRLRELCKLGLKRHKRLLCHALALVLRNLL
mmetsp:Transcript_94308/g.266768  ORF Transcript_94308/g.266768 Transcript_94308/m.266768 type:complete len:218 (+) Transcript_94308:163-816(+)